LETSIRRLAQLAGVSPSTAWRAIRGAYGIREETRLAILALARTHHIPLPASPARKTPDLLNSMCSIIPFDASGDRSSQVFESRLLGGVEAGAMSCGVETVNINRAAPAPLKWEWPLLANRRQVDGVVLLVGDETWLHPSFPGPVPSVFIFSGPPEADVVTVGDLGSSVALGQHLRRLGHRRVVYLGPQTDMSLRRLAGLRNGLDPCGGAVPADCVWIRRNIGGRAATVMLVDAILQRLRPGDPGENGFTAMMVYNDYMAAAAVMRLRERGVRVPEDVSVVGFDNVRPPWYDGPSLTTAAIPLEEIGAEAVRMLYWRLAHPDTPPRRLSLLAPFVAGETTQTPPVSRTSHEPT